MVIGIYRDNSESKHDNFFMKFNYELEENQDLILSFHSNNKDINSSGSTAWITPNASQKDKDSIINVQWKKSEGDIDTELGLYINDHINIYNDPDSFSSPYSEHKTDRITLNGNRTQYIGEHALSYGFDISNDKIDSTNNNQHETTNESIYLNDNYILNDRIKLSFGGRFDNHDIFGSEISPRVGAVVKLKPELNLRLSYGKAYSTPTFNDLYFVGPFGQGNPDLKPEKSTAYEIGFNYLGELFTGEISYFNRKTKDLINWADPDEDWVWEPYNLNSSSTNGFELNLTKPLMNNLTINFNYSYLDSADDETGNQLAPKQNTNIGLIYQMLDVYASLNARLMKDRPDNMDNYQVFDLRLAKEIEFAGTQAELSVKVNNIFNEVYQEVNGYPMPERNFMVELSTEI